MNNKFGTLMEFAIEYGKYLKPDSTDKGMVSFLESIKAETGYSCPSVEQSVLVNLLSPQRKAHILYNLRQISIQVIVIATHIMNGRNYINVPNVRNFMYSIMVHS